MNRIYRKYYDNLIVAGRLRMNFKNIYLKFKNSIKNWMNKFKYIHDDKIKKQKNMKKVCLYIVVAVAFIIVLNINAIKINFLCLTNNNSELITFIEELMQSEGKQDKNYFKKGIVYLASANDLENIEFLEEKFLDFKIENRVLIIEELNSKGYQFEDNTKIMKGYMEDKSNGSYREYIGNLSNDKFDNALLNMFTNTIIGIKQGDDIYYLLKANNNEHEIKGLKIDFLDLITEKLEDRLNESDLIIILEYADRELCTNNFFESLKDKSFEFNKLYSIFDLLKQYEVLDKNETKNIDDFKNGVLECINSIKNSNIAIESYNSVTKNITADISSKNSDISKITSDLGNINKQINDDKNKLKKLKESTFDASLYVVGATSYYGTGNEFEAAVPEWSNILNEYIPTQQRVIYKGNSTIPTVKGVISVRVRDNGMVNVTLKEDAGGFKQQWSYFSEITSKEENEMNELENAIADNQNKISSEENKISKLKNEVSSLQNNSEYNKNIKLKNQQEKNIDEQKKKIQNAIDTIKSLYGIKDIEVKIEEVKSEDANETTTSSAKEPVNLTKEQIKTSILKIGDIAREDIVLSEAISWGKNGVEKHMYSGEEYTFTNDSELSNHTCYLIFSRRALCYIVDSVTGKVYGYSMDESQKTYSLEYLRELQ